MGNAAPECGPQHDAMFSAEKATVRLELTDAPNDNIKSVYVNIDHAELRVRKGTVDGWVVVAKNLGQVDLLQLRNGVTLPMDSLQLPAGTEVSQIRLVLSADNNYIIKSTGEADERCDLKTPSEQQTGIKLVIHKTIEVAGGYSYKIVVDFDAEKSIVLTGNGGCLLKPVLKLKSATRVANTPPPQEPPVPNDPPTPQEPPVEEPIPTAGDNTVDEGSGGFEPPAFDPAPVIDVSDL